MTRLAAAIERLEAAGRVPIGDDLLHGTDASHVLDELFRTVERLSLTPPPDDRPSKSHLDRARAAWRAARGRIERLTRREVRALCWDPAVSLQPEFIRALEHHPELSQSRRWLEGLVENYFARWRDIPEVGILERLLCDSVLAFSGRSARLKRYKTAARHLFSDRAAWRLADDMLRERSAAAPFLARWHIAPDSGLGRAAANALCDEWLRAFQGLPDRRIPGSTPLEQARYVTESILASEFVTATQAARVVSALILWQQAEVDGEVQQHLRDHLLGHTRFGDPRLPSHGPIWDLCVPEARQRFTGWLAKEDLLFFFDTVIREDPHGRRDFWLKYIRRAAETRVVLSEEDADRVKAVTAERLAYAQVLGWQGTSAFIMRFHGTHGDIICVEFSRVGNALYIHDAEVFLRILGTLRRPAFHISRHLKNRTSAIERVIHDARGSWEQSARAILARLGVRPA